MLMIRFQRIGRTNDPAFRIAVMEKERAAKTGTIVEHLGTYNPRSKALTLSEARVQEWISKGAQPTDSVHNLLVAKGVIEGKKINALPKRTPQKSAAPEPSSAVEGATAAAEPTEAEVAAEAEPASTSEEAKTTEETPPVAATEVPAEGAPEQNEKPAVS